MKIKDCSRPKMKFKDLSIGDVFRFYDNLYLRVETTGGANAVCLVDGETRMVQADTLCDCVQGVFVVGGAE